MSKADKEKYWANAIVYKGNRIAHMSLSDKCSIEQAEDWYKNCLEEGYGYQVICSWLQEFDDNNKETVLNFKNHLPLWGIRIEREDL